MVIDPTGKVVETYGNCGQVGTGKVVIAMNYKQINYKLLPSNHLTL